MCGSLYQTCPKVPNFSEKHQNECYGEPKPGMFSCLTRMDKYPDEIFSQNIFNEEPLKLNKDFTFNSSGILCTDDKLIPWTEEGLNDLTSTTSCQSKTRRKVSGLSLRTFLIRDMGFRGRHYIPESYYKG